MFAAVDCFAVRLMVAPKAEAHPVGREPERALTSTVASKLLSRV